MTQELTWREQDGEYRLETTVGLTFVLKVPREKDQQGKVLSELEIFNIENRSIGYICGGRGFGFQQRGRASGFLVEYRPSLQEAAGLPQEQKRSLDYLLRSL